MCGSVKEYKFNTEIFLLASRERISKLGEIEWKSKWIKVQININVTQTQNFYRKACDSIQLKIETVKQAHAKVDKSKQMSTIWAFGLYEKTPSYNTISHVPRAPSQHLT